MYVYTYYTGCVFVSRLCVCMRACLLFEHAGARAHVVQVVEKFDFSSQVLRALSYALCQHSRSVSSPFSFCFCLLHQTFAHILSIPHILSIYLTPRWTVVAAI